MFLKCCKILLGTLSSFLERNNLLLIHSAEDRDSQVLAGIESSLQLLANLALRELKVVLGITVSKKERAKAILLNREQLQNIRD